MQRLLNTSEVPPDGFRFWQAETRTWVRAPDYDGLFSLVREHRKVNNIPLGTFWQAEVEDQTAATCLLESTGEMFYGEHKRSPTGLFTGSSTSTRR